MLPILWSLPTALMIGELASAIPAEGGFYVWVRRALGPFWGYQEGWLSLSASIFDMAIYPAIFVLYLGRFDPALTAGWFGYAWSLAVVGVCCVWNLRGAPAVGDGSVGIFVLLLAPFAVFVVLGAGRGFTLHPLVQWGNPGSGAALSTAVMVAMWNYMGWDNASTVAQEVEDPQRNYPRAMIAAAALVASPTSCRCSPWPCGPFGRQLLNRRLDDGGHRHRRSAAGHCRGGRRRHLRLGMFNALAMSYTRLPMAMAEDGMLPLMLARRNQRGVPWVSVLLCGLAWALALKLPFERLISIDLILYGSSLLLEFVALIVLRIREPELPRPFKAGNLAFACSLAIGPAALIAFALFASRNEKLIGIDFSASFATCVGCSDRCSTGSRLSAGAPPSRRRPRRGLTFRLAETAHRRYPILAMLCFCRYCGKAQTLISGLQPSREPQQSALLRRLRLVRCRFHLAVVLEHLHRPHHAIARIGRVVPPLHLHALALQILVDREEVRDLLQHVRVDVGVVPHIRIARIVFAHRQHLLVQHALVQHLKQANRTHLLHASWKARPPAPAPARPADRRRRSASME